VTAVPLPLKFQIGARTLATIPRRLVRVPCDLAAVRAGRVPPLPAPGGDGYLVTSLPAQLQAAVTRQGHLAAVRQRYTRYHVDLTGGHDAWLAGLSASARATIRRKTRRLAEASGGAIDLRAYRTPAELSAFITLARAVSATTYQERLLGTGLPSDAAALAALYRLAGADRVRAWLLWIGDRPVAYLCCTAEGDTLRYDHVGHDPAYAGLSPGTVLQAEALATLFADRFAAFDFTEGEGQHKRLFASGGTDCVDLLLLRPTIGNRVAVASVTAFDRAVAWAKRVSAGSPLAGYARRLRR